MSYLRLVMIICLLIEVVFSQEWNDIKENTNLSKSLGECKVGIISHIFVIPNGKITSGKVFQKGAWKWSGQLATYYGIVIPGDTANSAQHSGRFCGEYIINGTCTGKPMVWKAELTGCGEDHWAVYSLVLPTKPAEFPAEGSGIPGSVTYVDEHWYSSEVKILADVVICNQIIDNVITDLQPLPQGVEVTKCHVEKSSHTGGGVIGIPVPKNIVKSAKVDYHFLCEKEDSTSITFKGRDEYDHMVACLQAHFINTTTTKLFQLYEFRLEGDIPCSPSNFKHIPTYPDTTGHGRFWKEIAASVRQDADYTAQKGYIIYCKSCGHECTDCNNYFQDNKAPREPSGVNLKMKSQIK